MSDDNLSFKPADLIVPMLAAQISAYQALAELLINSEAIDRELLTRILRRLAESGDSPDLAERLHGLVLELYADAVSCVHPADEVFQRLLRHLRLDAGG